MKKSVKGETSSDPDVCDPFVSMLKNTEFPLKNTAFPLNCFTCEQSSQGHLTLVLISTSACVMQSYLYLSVLHHPQNKKSIAT